MKLINVSHCVFSVYRAARMVRYDSGRWGSNAVCRHCGYTTKGCGHCRYVASLRVYDEGVWVLQVCGHTAGTRRRGVGIAGMWVHCRYIMEGCGHCRYVGTLRVHDEGAWALQVCGYMMKGCGHCRYVGTLQVHYGGVWALQVCGYTMGTLWRGVGIAGMWVHYGYIMEGCGHCR